MVIDDCPILPPLKFTFRKVALYKFMMRTQERTEGFAVVLNSFFWKQVGKEPNCQCRRFKRCGFDPWVGKIPWRRACQPTSEFLLEKPKDKGDWQAAVHSVTVGHN